MDEELQSKMQAELDKYKSVEKEYHTTMTQKQLLESQLHETTGVKLELDLLKEDGEVYKLIGPVLMKQEVNEAKSNVNKRLGFITVEIKRIDDLLTSLEKKMNFHKERLGKLQAQSHQFQQGLAKAAAKTSA
ncbi:prefoldin subunit 6 [Cimex lectularius]|uniref:Probable prefoldin subunit 6 n=1 Tax=Cimex lectularius TaxID=79782 RepID=A0A8I6TDS0_CIMLE|nr:prefoldin subunit 6 [Cimex lectularius]